GTVAATMHPKPPGMANAGPTPLTLHKRRIPMKTWFITGASRGFGALVAQRALDNGDNVVATARNPQAVVDRLGQHPRLLPLALDVTDEAQARSAADVAVQRIVSIAEMYSHSHLRRTSAYA